MQSSHRKRSFPQWRIVRQQPEKPASSSVKRVAFVVWVQEWEKVIQVIRGKFGFPIRRLLRDERVRRRRERYSIRRRVDCGSIILRRFPRARLLVRDPFSMKPLDPPEIVFHGLLDLRELLLQQRIVVHPLRFAAVAMARDASRVALPTDGASFIALPMPDAASPASTGRGAHESAPALSQKLRGTS